MQSTRQVSRALEEIAALLEFAGESRFKAQAYRRAAEVVDTLGDELGPLVEQGRLQELEGIGATLSQQLEELWNKAADRYSFSLCCAYPMNGFLGNPPAAPFLKICAQHSHVFPAERRRSFAPAY